MDMARQLFHLGEIDHSIRIVDSLLTFRATMNSGLRYCLYVLKADLFYWNRNYSEAESHVNWGSVAWGAAVGAVTGSTGVVGKVAKFLTTLF